MMRTTPVDWVRNRARCNVHRLFAELRLQVARDVTAACETCGSQSFAIREEQSDLFVVTAPGERLITFRLTGSRIEATEATTEGRKPLRLPARAEYDGDSGCRLAVRTADGRRRFELWEFSREALEDVFFPPERPPDAP